ncbi:cyclodeaminase/cyclohydrolase family protein [Clostridium aminobutyricum]|uniref:Cyclodeaminase/cyclohydrolase family protein n=1 Tax=Clostridium aminobutyricum TaxID=33953 RepID=A0A939DBF4_CLOAM|nr:cyclodeaminase/cyclohydrolase family protein [Clostridium aminobutyricum]MBN7774517.1 cyclodeaminase/cyclohydrolase family protein [Clostridium aminobutyricum]
MKLVEMTVNEYLDVLKSDAPAPGGGSVSALAGAQGAGLLMMVCDLTTGKEKYADYQEICVQAKTQAAALQEALTEAIDKDTEAFNLVSAAFKMPKGSDEEKRARSQAIAEGTLVATEVPYSVMTLAYEGLQEVKNILGKFNTNAASDLGVAVLNLMTCIKGAWLNVKINLPGVKDEAKKRVFQEEGESLVRDAEKLADELYLEIAKSLE